MQDLGRQSVPLWKALAFVGASFTIGWGANNIRTNDMVAIDGKLATKADVRDVSELKTTISSLTTAVQALNVSVAKLETRLGMERQ